MLNFPLAFFQRRWNVTNPCLLAFAQGYVVLAFELSLKYLPPPRWNVTSFDSQGGGASISGTANFTNCNISSNHADEEVKSSSF